VSADALAAHWPQEIARKLAASVMTDAPVFPYSSTDLRLAIDRGENPPPDALEPAVLDWIHTQRLYQNEHN